MNDLTIGDLLPIFVITLWEYKVFQSHHLSHNKESYYIKLSGILFRNQRSYLRFPMTVQKSELNLYSQPHVWAWQAWMQIKDDITKILNDTPHGLYNREKPPCWQCMYETNRKCLQCKNTTEKYGLRQIPTCALCDTRKACREDRGDMSTSDTIKNRFTFHLDRVTLHSGQTGVCMGSSFSPPLFALLQQ